MLTNFHILMMCVLKIWLRIIRNSKIFKILSKMTIDDAVFSTTFKTFKCTLVNILPITVNLSILSNRIYYNLDTWINWKFPSMTAFLPWILIFNCFGLLLFTVCMRVAVTIQSNAILGFFWCKMAIFNKRFVLFGNRISNLHKFNLWKCSTF